MQETDEESKARHCRWVEERRGLLFRVVHASGRSLDD
jgi:hypothetical protein